MRRRFPCVGLLAYGRGEQTIAVRSPTGSPWRRSLEVADGLTVFRLRGPEPAPIHAALLADTHVGLDPAAMFNSGHQPFVNATDAALQAQHTDPEIVCFLGDLAWGSGEEGDYGRWQQIFHPLLAARPAVLLPGNHDRRDRMLRRFAADAPADAERILSVVETPTMRLIALDSLYRTDVVPGLLGETQRRWLAGFLDTHDHRPTVILVHHHLGADDQALLDGDRLLALLQVRPQVKAVISGHQHAHRCELAGRLHLVGAPAIGMPFQPDERLGWLEATLDERGCRCAFAAWRGGRRRAAAADVGP